MKINVAVHSDNLLGEGPVWSVDHQALYWVDVLKPSLNKWKPETGEVSTWILKEHLGSFAIRNSDEAVVATRIGFGFLDFKSGLIEYFNDPESHLTDTRFNDGKCDRSGRFWAGTMHYSENKSVGGLYRLDLDLSVKKMRSDVFISNGMGWSPDNRIMYYTDSFTQCIYAFDFDIRTGLIANERIFTKLDEGYPDGLTVDSQGFIWSAVWDGWSICRFAPDGSLDRQVRLPVQRPTSCIFGGTNLDRLYITTARKGLSPEELSTQPFAGCVLEIFPGVKGLPETSFAG